MGYIFQDVMIVVILAMGVGDGTIQCFICEHDRLKSSFSQIIKEDNHLTVKDECSISTSHVALMLTHQENFFDLIDLKCPWKCFKVILRAIFIRATCLTLRTSDL